MKQQSKIVVPSTREQGIMRRVQTRATGILVRLAARENMDMNLPVETHMWYIVSTVKHYVSLESPRTKVNKYPSFLLICRKDHLAIITWARIL